MDLIIQSLIYLSIYSLITLTAAQTKTMNDKMERQAFQYNSPQCSGMWTFVRPSFHAFLIISQGYFMD